MSISDLMYLFAGCFIGGLCHEYLGYLCQKGWK